MSDLADTLRQLGKEYGQAGGYIHLELADKADALERDVKNIARERDVYLRKLDEVDRFVSELETHAMAFIPGTPGEDAYNTAAELLRKIIGRKMGYDD